MSASDASTFATGGGGVRLEHRYAALLLTAVLAGDPVSELGDSALPLLVRLQASDISPVDDLVVEGHTPDGALHRVSIGVRHEPALTAGDRKSPPLIRSFLQVVTRHWDEVRAGRWRLALAASVPTAGVRETMELAAIASSTRSEMEFRDAIVGSARGNSELRRRLEHLDALVVKAASVEDDEEENELEAFEASQLTWRLLFALRVRLIRLEGVDETDRTTAVSALRRVVADGSVSAADAVFSALAEQSGAWASTGARVDQALLRRALSGYALNRSGAYTTAWAVLGGLSRRLRAGIHPGLSAGDVHLELERKEQREGLLRAVSKAGRAGSALTVTGEPGVGKSALTLRVAEHLAGEGAAVLSLSLRDLPASVLDVEHQLGGIALADLLAASDVRPVRLLVIDGAETVLEGRSELLRELAAGAMRAGIGVVAVTRLDGASRVADDLRSATSLVGRKDKPAEHAVAWLTQAERRLVVQTFTSMLGLAADGRAEWLIGRPGLVDLLLRAGAVADTSGLLCEADMFAAVWNGLIRKHDEYGPDRASPDDRERASLVVARRLFRLPEGSVPGGSVWPQLRSDGVLRIPANPAFATGDEFTTDLIRDFAVCRLLITADLKLLRETHAPRWAVRAVRLVCQSKLLRGDRAAIWRGMRNEFDLLAEAEGRRWAEVPFEALLTLGDAADAIEQVWDQLTDDGQSGLSTLLRLAQLRYVVAETFGDPFVLGPLVATMFCADRDLGQHQRRVDERSTGGMIRSLVLAWLRGMVRDGRGPDQLRQQVRDRILASGPDAYDEFAVEALSTLGQDTNDDAGRWLRAVAAEHPHRLDVAIGSVAVAVGMVDADSQLLLDLTEAFCIERRERGGRLARIDGLSDGIRRLRHGFGLSAPRAAWYYGPFFRLLCAAPNPAIAMINRILNHAAEARVQHARQRRDEPGDEGIDLDLPGVGTRHFIGDEHVWGWYRGSTVGPYLCMSALLAVERFADQLIDTGVPPEKVVGLLLRDCRNLAMPGLIVGLLVRHMEAGGDLIDPWLTHPDIWALEFSRTASEGLLHAQGRDADDVVGRERRCLTPFDLAARMIFSAMLAGDQERLTAMAAIGDLLLANARAIAEPEQAPRGSLQLVEGWAASLRAENYRIHRNPDATYVLEYQPPQPVADWIEASAAQFDDGSHALRLQRIYAHERISKPQEWPPADTLIADIEFARRLAAEHSVGGVLHPEDPVAAVAAAAVIGHARGRVIVDDGDLRWAAATLLKAAAAPRLGALSYESTCDPWAADRSAAAALPLLLLPSFDHLAVDRIGLADALTALATGLFNEVRTMFVAGCAQVWSAACEIEPSQVCRRHASLWTAVQSGLRDCYVGAWDQNEQHRVIEPLAPPYTDTLPPLAADDLLVDRLAMPIACAAAARTSPCVSDQARALLPVLLDAHRRGTDYWTREEGDEFNDPQRELIAGVLVDLAANGESEPLAACITTFAGNATALHHLLLDLAVLFTYDIQQRSRLTTVWPLVLGTALDAIDAGADLRGDRHWADYALAALLPAPEIRPADLDPDDTLRTARAAWIAPEELEPFADRWIALAVCEPKAADAVAQFARTCPTLWQASIGLTWLERIINNRYALFAGRCWYVLRWLTDLRPDLEYRPDQLRQWQRIVDALAAAGDTGATDLQQTDE